MKLTCEKHFPNYNDECLHCSNNVNNEVFLCEKCGTSPGSRPLCYACYNNRELIHAYKNNPLREVRQPRFDWEAKEQRTNDLEDLVLQLVERVEKLENPQSAVTGSAHHVPPSHMDNIQAIGQELEPASEDGHHIARALEKMSAQKT